MAGERSYVVQIKAPAGASLSMRLEDSAVYKLAQYWMHISVNKQRMSPQWQEPR